MQASLIIRPASKSLFLKHLVVVAPTAEATNNWIFSNPLSLHTLRCGGRRCSICGDITNSQKLIVLNVVTIS